MNVLGISAYYHDAAAALVNEAGIISAAQEERFSRIKGDWRFPEEAIAFCLVKLADGARPDLVAYYEDPVQKAARIVETTADAAPDGAQIWPATLRSLSMLEKELPARLAGLCPDAGRIRFVAHHRSHAASAFFPSPFESAAVLVVDGVGEWSTTSIWSGDQARLTPLHEVKYPHSLGLLYSAFTQYCGFKVNSGEYKLMGLAPFGSPVYAPRILEHVVDLRTDGSFRLNPDYFGFRDSESTLSPALEDLLGGPARVDGERPDRHTMDVAASAQAVIEECMLALARTALAQTRSNRLCLAGGVALNCVANARLLRDLPELEEIWIQPAAGDAGGALGAALQVSVSETGKRPRQDHTDTMKHSFLGPTYSEVSIRDALDAVGIHYSRPQTSAEYCKQVANELASGRILGHFDGPMEFGPRALGNRSILADPRDDDALARVNQSIKFREGWRPFGPMVLSEHAATYFTPPSNSPYMLLVSHVKKEFRLAAADIEAAQTRGLDDAVRLQANVNTHFPAISHVDFSARLQTIDRSAPSRARQILEAFFEQTRCPILLNTSFNVRGEPIVCKPQDAIDCFLQTQMDTLAIGPFIAHKSQQDQTVLSSSQKRVFDAD